MNARRREHVASRPTWRCRACGIAWPCGAAKLGLLAEYGGRRAALLIHLATLWAEATAQLAGSEAAANPTALYERFTAWARAHAL
ncbi:flavin reductase [Micromonospora sp. WMMD1082]|uniref:flavin reductase n=1 Tax=Micromonospora sp. WMMD1082 TaxID=3016104 RepID=UPI0024172643|nr:flavin reductase [Micromonospora sp. WMMD1082]MDG4798046.1 flavin reductase [Micromonospora sp. WMMD1082]